MCRQEIAELQKQINTKLVDHEQSDACLDELAAEVKALESSILDKQTQVAALEEELKQVNLELFAAETSSKDDEGGEDGEKEEADEKCKLIIQSALQTQPQ